MNPRLGAKARLLPAATATALLAIVALAGTLAARAEDAPEWRPLFDGRGLSGWVVEHPELWSVEDGELVGRSKGLLENRFLFSEKRYGDFDLRYEVRLVGDVGNGGVQIRSERLPDGHAKGYQVDIGKGYWASLYHELGRGMLAHFKREEGAPDDPIRLDGYNLFEVSCRGHRVTVKVNGTTTVDLEDPEGELEGLIAPQLHSGGPMEVRFRKMEIREHAAKPAATGDARDEDSDKD